MEKKKKERTRTVTCWNGARRYSLLHAGAFCEVALEVPVAGLFVVRASTNSGPMWGSIAKPRLMCCHERPVDQTDFVSGVYKYNSLPGTLFPKIGADLKIADYRGL